MTEPELLTRLAQLERTVAELERGRQPISRTLRCPCGGRHILHFTRLYERADGGVVAELALHSGSFSKFWRRFSQQNALEAFACVACGNIEFRVKSFEGIHADGDLIVEHEPDEPTPDPPPYR